MMTSVKDHLALFNYFLNKLDKVNSCVCKEPPFGTIFSQRYVDMCLNLLLLFPMTVGLLPSDIYANLVVRMKLHRLTC